MATFQLKTIGLTVPVWFYWNTYRNKWEARIDLHLKGRGETEEDAYSMLLSALAKHLEQEKKEHDEIANAPE